MSLTIFRWCWVWIAMNLTAGFSFKFPKTGCLIKLFGCSFSKSNNFWPVDAACACNDSTEKFSLGCTQVGAFPLPLGILFIVKTSSLGKLNLRLYNAGSDFFKASMILSTVSRLCSICHPTGEPETEGLIDSSLGICISNWSIKLFSLVISSFIIPKLCKSWQEKFWVQNRNSSWFSFALYKSSGKLMFIIKSNKEQGISND